MKKEYISAELHIPLSATTKNIHCSHSEILQKKTTKNVSKIVPIFYRIFVMAYQKQVLGKGALYCQPNTYVLLNNKAFRKNSISAHFVLVQAGFNRQNIQNSFGIFEVKIRRFF